MREGGDRAGPSGWVFDIRRYSVHDGPGIRTTVFLKGCALRCAWCHNPESQSAEPQLLYRADRCILCGECVEACSVGAVALHDDRVTTDPARCEVCGACADACPTDARAVVGRRMSADEVLEAVEHDRLFYDESGGGATFSGGEPLHQPAFIRSLLVGCRERGIRSALDTAGHALPAIFAEIAHLADVVLFDLKHMDAVRHRDGTGVANDLILTNLRHLAAAGGEVVVRIPLVPGFNDTASNLQRTAAFLTGLERVPLVQLLPFHTAAQEKHRRFGVPYRQRDGTTHAEPALNTFRSWFERAGVRAEIGG